MGNICVGSESNMTRESLDGGYRVEALNQRRHPRFTTEKQFDNQGNMLNT